ncbi:MAG TPA: HAMP domain-containing sensor histidine kinase [Pyrinomonadaceae bacterium]|jgi:signal transduction histidine kinase|nr:HAMP domain-containing sensor histidine kinase [Pyrinomonadaceae bacterium]
MMRGPGRRNAVIFFAVLGISLVILAVALNIGWILLNLQQIALLVLGIIFFALIITGLILNTLFLIREIRRNEQHDAFINAVTHELKTPIASIRLYLETLKKRDVTEEQRKEFYDVMLADSDRLLHTVEQVLQAGRTRIKSRRIDSRPVELNKLLRETIEIARQRHRLGEDAMHFVEPEKPVKVIGDAQELQTAVTNLLDNAVKYSRQRINVSMKVTEIDEKRIAVKVSDTGIGIPNRELKRIFSRFYRAPQRIVQNIKGTGLGLSIVYAVVKRHGGRVSAESAGVGKGSTFIIELPRAENK